MREVLNFDKTWMFHKGDVPTTLPINKRAIYNGAKTERMLWGPAAQAYDTGIYATEPWKCIDLPHDFVIEGLPDQKYNEALGFFDYQNAWYVKKFTVPESDRNRRITLFFEGVATRATVYVNGCLLKHNFCGYTGFEVDMSDVVQYGKKNTVAVYVNTQEHEGWWYEGGGIYRHVWLEKTELTSLDRWGVYVKPMRQTDGSWQVEVETTVRNDSIKSIKACVLGELLDPDGNPIATAEAAGRVEQKDKRILRYRMTVAAPKLWSPETPVQYTLRTRLLRGKQEVDTEETRFGFRTARLDADHGLFINDKHYKIKGLCGHADFGLSGKAVPDNIHRYKVSLMKEMGANGYRATHYPQAPALMDALDENGFIVMDETRRFESSEESLAQLEMLIKRDRNRPSVFFWCIGNEEPYHKTEEGLRIARSMKAFLRKLDDTRFVVTAVHHSVDSATVFEEMDVACINYDWHFYDSTRALYPHKAFLSSENCATGTTRGHYFEDEPEKAFLSAYDHDANSYFKSREFTWRFISERDWVIGGYQWIAFEHRGEALWPRLCSQSGAIDLFMQKKDAFWQNKSHWTDEPMVHLLPHWNFRGMEGEPIRVFAYSNVPELELFLNGKSLGKQSIGRIDHGEWTVPYEAGRLEVVASRDGEVVARDVRITSGEGKRLKLSLETPELRANGEDLAVVSCWVVDENGNEVYDAAYEVTFHTNPLGQIYSTGSDITDHSSLFLSTRRMRAGRVTATVKVGRTAGEMKVYARANGLETAVLSVELKP